MNLIEHIITDYKSGTTVKLYLHSNVMKLTNLQTPLDNRNMGGARRVMLKAIALAGDLPIELIILPDDDTDWDRLYIFYRQFGFKSVPGNKAMMRRDNK